MQITNKARSSKPNDRCNKDVYIYMLRIFGDMEAHGHVSCLRSAPCMVLCVHWDSCCGNIRVFADLNGAENISFICQRTSRAYPASISTRNWHNVESILSNQFIPLSKTCINGCSTTLRDGSRQGSETSVVAYSSSYGSTCAIEAAAT